MLANVPETIEKRLENGYIVIFQFSLLVNTYLSMSIG
jgi:hypothetical protein